MQDNTLPEIPDVYALVTDKIIELLNAGTIPWRKPWTNAGKPRNLLSKRPYRGVNLLLLNALPYEQNLFLTWKQIKTIRGSVLRGEKGNIVIFNKMLTSKVEKDGKSFTERKVFLRYYKVFNVAQCRDIPLAFMPVDQKQINDPIEECERIVAGYSDCPPISHEEEGAFYEPDLDYINVPRMSSFLSSPDYYATLFHELIHSTGHKRRSVRKEVYQNPEFGTDMYSMEELVAEMGACYLKSHSGIPIGELENNAAYIDNWLTVFKGDTQFVVIAAAKAHQAAEYILKVPETKDESEQMELHLGDVVKV